MRNPRREAPRPPEALLREAGFYACMMDCGLLVAVTSCGGTTSGVVYRVVHRSLDCSEPSVLVPLGYLVAAEGGEAARLEEEPGEAVLYASKKGGWVVAVLAEPPALLAEKECGGAPWRYFCVEDLSELGDLMLA